MTKEGNPTYYGSRQVKQKITDTQVAVSQPGTLRFTVKNCNELDNPSRTASSFVKSSDGCSSGKGLLRSWLVERAHRPKGLFMNVESACMCATAVERVRRLLTYQELVPISTRSGEDFFVAFLQIVRCHYILWKIEIFSIDVSAQHSLLRKDTDNAVVGVLNDWDLAVSEGGRHRGHTERAGTITFMPLELLTDEAWKQDVKRHYQHDLEAFIWVMTWICLRYEEEGKLCPQTPLHEWWTGDFETCYEKKVVFLDNPTRKIPAGPNRSVFNVFALPLLRDLKRTTGARNDALALAQAREREDEVQIMLFEDEGVKDPDTANATADEVYHTFWEVTKKRAERYSDIFSVDKIMYPEQCQQRLDLLSQVRSI